MRLSADASALTGRRVADDQRPRLFVVGICWVFKAWAPPKPTFLGFFMVNHLVVRWPKPLFFMVLGAHGRTYRQK